MHAAGTIFREEGLRGLWAGAAPTVMRNGTNQMCLFWAKNNFDGLFFGKEEGDGRVLAPWQSMLSGFSAACLGPVATGPFDVIKVSCSRPCIAEVFSTCHAMRCCSSKPLLRCILCVFLVLSSTCSNCETHRCSLCWSHV